jgi:hypothetical protein
VPLVNGALGRLTCTAEENILVQILR